MSLHDYKEEDTMKTEDRGCFNCEGCRVVEIPLFRGGKTSLDQNIGLSECMQRLSDHFQHITTLRHSCAWHSDLLKSDSRYSFWQDTIESKDGRR